MSARVLFVTSEAHPLIKTGGLADVAGGLPPALIGEGADVRVMLPAYPSALARLAEAGEVLDLGDPLGVGQTRLIGGRMPDSGVPAWLVDCPALFDRPGGPYLDEDGRDWPDNHLRFALLARVAATVGLVGGPGGWRPDVVHANDWQSGLLPVYLHRWGGRRPGCVFTIHNIQFQGIFDPAIIEPVGLGSDLFHMEGIEFHGQVSYLKAALRFADKISTVSPTYAREIQGPDMGFGLDGLLRARAADLSGILNGADYGHWNPAADPFLAKPFDEAGVAAGKRACKADLQRRLGLDQQPDAPLLGVVSRLSEQKGLDLLLSVLDGVFERGAQLVVLGGGERWQEAAFRTAASARPTRMATRNALDEELAHQIYGGCDMLLIPSRFEPCGLTQMYAMRYATVPVARRTGGLADTIVDAEDKAGTGFLFDEATPHGLWTALERALALYARPKAWQTLRKRAMRQDFGWGRAARAYLDLYAEAKEQR